MHLFERPQLKDLLPSVFLVFLALIFLVSNRHYRDFYYVAVLPVFLFHAWRIGLPRLPPTGLVACALGTLAYGAVSALWGGAFGFAEFAEHLRVAVLIASFLAILAVLAHEVPDFPIKLTWTLALAGTVSGLAAASEFYAVAPLSTRLPPALSTEDIIYGATMLGSGAALLPVVVLDRARPVVLRAGAALLYLALAALVVLSQSRGVLLGLLVALGVLLIASGRRVAVPLAALASATVGAVVLAPFDAVSFIQRADAHRLDIWANALALWAERPLFGHGLEHGLVFARFGGMTIIDAHNVFLDALVSGGLVGLGLLAGLCLGCLAVALRELRESGDPWLLTLLAYSLISAGLHFGEILDNASAIWIFFWLPVGIALGLQLRRRSQRPRAPARTPASSSGAAAGTTGHS